MSWLVERRPHVVRPLCSSFPLLRAYRLAHPAFSNDPRHPQDLGCARVPKRTLSALPRVPTLSAVNRTRHDRSMRVGSVILFLAAAAGASTAAGDASSGAPASDSLIGRAHRAAVRHSAGLARDLRVAFRGVLRERRDTSSPLANQRIMAAQKPYCVSGQPGTSPANPGVVHNGTTSASGPKSTTATRSTTRTASATTTQGGATPTASSAWQIWKDYVGPLNLSFDAGLALTFPRSPAARSLTSGTLPSEATQQTVSLTTLTRAAL